MNIGRGLRGRRWEGRRAAGKEGNRRGACERKGIENGKNIKTRF
jgi:hypothetical protein